MLQEERGALTSAATTRTRHLYRSSNHHSDLLPQEE
jgi:hypothetical protein